MASKPKVEVAREHLSKAQDEAVGGDLRDAVQWSFASLEAVIDALAEKRDIAIDEKHWRRSEAATELKETGFCRGTSLACIVSSMKSARPCSMRARILNLGIVQSRMC